MPNQLVIRAPAGLLTRGQSFAVPIVLTLEEPLKVRGIHARFWGAEETKADYTTTSTDDKGNTTTNHHTAVEHVNVVDQQSTLQGQQQHGFFYNLGDGLATLFGGGKHEVLAPGEYPFELQITVPEGAPATCAGKKSRVFYELSAWVDIPLGIDLKAMQPFELPALPVVEQDLQPVRVCYPDDAGRGFWDSLLAPDVRIELALAADAARAGDTVEGIVVIEIEKPVVVQALRVNFIGVEQTQAQGHRDSVQYASQAVEVANPGAIQGRYSQTFSLPAELPGPPTVRGTNFSIDWFVQVEIDVPWAKDPKIRAPIRLLATS